MFNMDTIFPKYFQSILIEVDDVDLTDTRVTGLFRPLHTLSSNA